MKKIYSAPVANKVELQKADVIATSFFISSEKQVGLGTTTGWGDGTAI